MAKIVASNHSSAIDKKSLKMKKAPDFGALSTYKWIISA